jgi:type III pantothenate kinase
MKCDFIIDIGNSNFKVAALENDEITEIYRFNKEEDLKLIQLIKNKNVILSNVAKSELLALVEANCNLLFYPTNSIDFPFYSEYKTKETWGMDRACNVAAASYYFPERNVLIVDIGTCLKFDLIDKTNTYLGGSISPGIRLRFESLATQTANLPLLQHQIEYDLIGKSTSESIINGVINGCYSEILGLIQQYEDNFDDLQIIITGGDSFYFDFNEKSNIFADENLTLKGLYQLYLFNEE